MGPVVHRISSADVHLNAEAKSKQEVLALLAAQAAGRLAVPQAAILQALLAREELGSTALGKGVALPHAQIPDASQPVVMFLRLRRPVEFDARDGEAVDLVALFLWPKAETKSLLGAMADMCRVLREPTVLRKVRSAEQPEDVARLLNDRLGAAASLDDLDPDSAL